MAAFETKDGTRIYYNDWGRGQPIVFSHGWPLSADAFEDQMFYLTSRGYRVLPTIAAGMGAQASLGTATTSTPTPMIWPSSLPNSISRTRFTWAIPRAAA